MAGDGYGLFVVTLCLLNAAGSPSYTKADMAIRCPGWQAYKMRKRFYQRMILVCAAVAAYHAPSDAQTPKAQVEKFTLDELSRMAFDDWAATLPGTRSRPEPDGPIVLEWTQVPYPYGIGLNDGLSRGDVTSFYRWCDAHHGAGTSTPNPGDPIEENFRKGGVPSAAYIAIAASRDGQRLPATQIDVTKLGNVERRNLWHDFALCSDGGHTGLGTFTYMIARNCDRIPPDHKTPISCRALIYDRRAIAKLDQSVRPKFTAIAAKIQAEEDRMIRWRTGISPGDETAQGLVVQRNGAVVLIQNVSGATRWFKVEDLSP
jgi:hypothetical protein